MIGRRSFKDCHFGVYVLLYGSIQLRSKLSVHTPYCGHSSMTSVCSTSLEFSSKASKCEWQSKGKITYVVPCEEAGGLFCWYDADNMVSEIPICANTRLEQDAFWSCCWQWAFGIDGPAGLKTNGIDWTIWTATSRASIGIRRFVSNPNMIMNGTLRSPCTTILAGRSTQCTQVRIRFTRTLTCARTRTLADRWAIRWRGSFCASLQHCRDESRTKRTKV